MAGIVGTMSTLGWVDEPTVMIDKLFSYWIANRRDQCIILTGIQSFDFVIGSHQGDTVIDKFLDDAEESFRSMLLECFDNVQVSVMSPDHEQAKKNFTLAISGTVYKDGIGYDLARSVILNGKTFELIQQGE